MQKVNFAYVLRYIYLYSEVLIFILELLSEMKSDSHEILQGALVYGDL